MPSFKPIPTMILKVVGMLTVDGSHMTIEAFRQRAGLTTGPADLYMHRLVKHGFIERIKRGIYKQSPRLTEKLLALADEENPPQHICPSCRHVDCVEAIPMKAQCSYANVRCKNCGHVGLLTEFARRHFNKDAPMIAVD